MAEEPSSVAGGEAGWGRQQKPFSGPLQRIINETGVQRSKSPGKLTSGAAAISPQQPVLDKENVQLLTTIDKRPITLSSRSLSRDMGEISDYLSQEALSSTLAVQQSSLSTPERLKSSLFSTSNLSSISLVVNASQGSSAPSPPQDGRYKTPKRPGEIASHTGAFSTPSTGSGKSAKGSSTPSNSSSPWSSGSGIRYNPFDSHLTSDQLHLPTLSPSVFATVTSPSNEQSVNGQFWNIEQQAELYPTTISEDSPLKQSILHKHHRPESEAKMQKQIDLYFETNHDVKSPPDLAPTGPLLIQSPNTSYAQPDTGKSSKWTQTVLTFPEVLPPQVENILRQYNFLTDVMTDEPNNLSNSTLRRKLFNGDRLSDQDDLRSSSESEDDTSPVKMSPGRIIHTPVTSKSGVNTAQWSSSPVRPQRHRTSISPPDLQSPMFSPIAKNRVFTRRTPGSGPAGTPVSDKILHSVSRIQEENFQEEIEVEEGVEVVKDAANEEKEGDLQDNKDTSELYQTAEIADMTSASVNMTCNNLTSNSCFMDTDSNSGAAWGLTLPTQNEDSNMNTESRIDTGYATSTVSSMNPSGFQDSVQPSSLELDSGVVSRCQQPELTVSLILPQHSIQQQHQQSMQHQVAQQQPPVVMMSYAAEENNDISVGFPLVSSTPTKR